MPATRHNLLKARFALTRRLLNQIIDRITPDMLEWAPEEGMRTISGQLAEILCVELPLVPRLKEGKMLDEAEVDAIVGDLSSLENLRCKLVDVRQTTLDYLETLSDGELSEEVSIGAPWFGSMWMQTLPRAEIFLNIAEHESYHVGQLISYMWLRGDNPYSWTGASPYSSDDPYKW